MKTSSTSYSIKKVKRFVRRNLPGAIAKTGRPQAMSDADLLVAIIWDGLHEQHQTIKGMYQWLKRDWGDCFVNLATYETFLRHCHRLAPWLEGLLQKSLRSRSKLVFADSSLLPVCANHKTGRHQVAQRLATWGKNHQGWKFGFKLHLAVNSEREITACDFSNASAHDCQHMAKLVNRHTKILVGDSHYGVGHWGR